MPCWPFRLNLDSPQAEGLIFCAALFAGHRVAFDLTGKNQHLPLNIGAMTLAASNSIQSLTWRKSTSSDNGAEFPSPYFTVSAPFTMMWRGVPTGWNGSNPGVWRTGTPNPTATTFMIFQSNTGRPWIRWNNVDALKPLSGYAVPLNEQAVMLWSIRSGEQNFYNNGLLQHSASTAVTNPSGGNELLRFFGWQAAQAESVSGEYQEIRFYNRTANDGLARHVYDPATTWDLYEPSRPTFVTVPAAAVVSGRVPSGLALLGVGA